jgi:hypothetical protein
MVAFVVVAVVSIVIGFFLVSESAKLPESMKVFVLK